MRSYVCLFSLLTLLLTALPVGAAEPWMQIIEGESMSVRSGWRVATGREGFFPASPNEWSGNRLRADAGDVPAAAESRINIPSSGRYALWVRFESAYGFNSLFDVEIEQGGKRVYSGRFGGARDLKYFPNGRGWRIQEAWAYHNSDFAYQRGEAQLAAGPARLILKKGVNASPAAARVIDLICLSDDMAMEPGSEHFGWRENARVVQQPPVISRALQPVWVCLRVTGSEPAGLSIHYTQWGYYGYLGPNRFFTFTDKGLDLSHDGKKLQQIALPAGFDSGWQQIDLSRLRPASFLAKPSGGPVTLFISRRADGKDAIAFNLHQAEREILVGTGNSLIEDGMLQGRTAAIFGDYMQRAAAQLRDTPVNGRRAVRYGILGALSGVFDGFDSRELLAAAGINGEWFGCRPEIAGPEGKRFGFKQDFGFKSLQNAHLKQEYYEGDYSKLETAYRRVMDELRKQGLGDLPQNSKMIEEAGPPALATLRTYKGINERFRAYLKEQGIKPVQVLPRTVLAEAVLRGKTGEADLWNMVTLGEGKPQEAADNPVLFYHSKMFGSHVFVDNCANATRIFEKVFPKGSLANSGAFYPQDGHGVRRNWYDEFMLFRERGFTAYHSEMSWGQGGMAHYIGPQSESYQGAIARGLAKYHDVPMGAYLMSTSTYGYVPEYTEVAAYAQASHGFQWLNLYGSGLQDTGVNTPSMWQAIKRLSWSIGAVEDRLLESKTVPARVALGWSETTAIWDQAEAPYPGFLPPGNVMYHLERHYLYLLLRHMQIPVDLLSEADIAEGRLKDYHVYFMVGDHMKGDAAEALKKWVGEGGTLVSAAGGGLWNEYNHPAGVLNEVYGISGMQTERETNKDFLPGIDNVPSVTENRLVKEAQALRAKLELIHANPMDEISISGYDGKLPVMGYRQGFKAENGRVLGKFRNGEAAVVANNYGKGKALIMGFLPGIGYLYKAFPMVPYGRGGEDLSNYLYPDYKPLVREALGKMLKEVWPGMGAAVICSNPYVEANLMKDKSGKYHIALVNYSGKRIDNLQVTIRQADTGNAKGVKAAFGKAEIKSGAGLLTVTMPLDKFDWLSLE